MATYHFSGTVAWNRLGPFLTTGRGVRTRSVIDPSTGLTPAGLTQNGVAVTQITADPITGQWSFSTTDVLGVMIDWGAGPDLKAANEATNLVLTASAATDSAMAAAIGNPASATRLALGLLFTIDTNYATLEDALTATATGGTLEIRGTWSRSTTFTVNKACTIRFANNASITTTSSSIKAISVTANDVYLDGPRVFGTGSASSSTGIGIYAAGTLASPLTGLRIRAPKCQDFTQYGINLEFCKGFSIERPRIDNIAYGGIMMASCWEGEIAGGSVKNLTMPSPLVNAYGVAASYNEASGIVTNPQSRDITIRDMLIDGVSTWEGIDTHAGINIKVLNNTVKNCRTGIAIVPGKNAGASPVLAPKNITVSGNVIDSGYTNGTNTVGITFVGCSTTIGFFNNTDYATGKISGNTIIECGNDAATTGCAMNLQDTLGVVVSGNTFVNPVVSAIRLDYNNKDAVVQGNTATDVWTNTAAYAAMIQTNQWNTAKISGNAVTRGTKSATTINSVGLRVNSALATVIVEQGNDFLGATAAYSLATPLIRFDQHGVRHSYVTASPTMGVWQASAQALNTATAAGGSPGWVVTTAGGGSSATWAATTAYSAAAWIKTSTGKVLECVVAGTSSGSEPSPSTIDATVTDGTVTWVYRSATSAVFKAMPNVAA